MPVTDQQVAALRAQLAGSLAEHKRLLADLGAGSDRLGYSALLTAAFYNAVDLRFTSNTDPADVIEFVADVRARSERVRDALDPRVAERVLLAALTDEDLDDLDSALVTQAKMFLLAAIVADQQFDDSGLDEFMGKARSLADSLLT